MTFYDSGAFGCLVWAVFGAACCGVARLLLPLIELVPSSSAARAMLLLMWTGFLVISGWCMVLNWIGGKPKARSTLLWLFYGWIATLGASLVLLLAYAVAGHAISRDWQLVLGMLVLWGYLYLIFPVFNWLLDKYASKP